jgi:hypothetical protein
MDQQPHQFDKAFLTNAFDGSQIIDCLAQEPDHWATRYLSRDIVTFGEPVGEWFIQEPSGLLAEQLAPDVVK